MSGCRIHTRGRGPLAVEGPFELLGEEGEVLATPPVKRVLLCRCGASASRPFCDGAHNRIPTTPDPSEDESS